MTPKVVKIPIIEVGLAKGAAYTVKIDVYHMTLRASPGAGCAHIVDWLLPKKDDEGVIRMLLARVMTLTKHHKTLLRVVVPVVDQQFISVLQAEGFAVSLSQANGRFLELTRKLL